MENVLAAFIIIFLIVFGALTLTDKALSGQDTLREAWQDMEARLDDQARTSLQPVEGYTTHMGTVAIVVLRNNGTVSLSDFKHWDAFLQYYDAGNPPTYRTGWLRYGSDWTLDGIYMDASEKITEVYEPGILNPGEEVALQLRSASPIGAGTAVEAVLSTTNGVATPFIFMSNKLPELIVNLGPVIAVGKSITISPDYLQTADEDDTPDQLTYTLIALPTEGNLSFETTFTQTDIDEGKLTYTHSGLQSDAFQFSVTDGKDTIGNFTFTITVSAPPVLAINSGLNLEIVGSTVAFDPARLQVTDPDDAPENLVYTVTRAPSQGTLNLSSSFTQADIDNGLLTYSHTGNSSDRFEITISDGETTVGPYEVTINVLPIG